MTRELVSKQLVRYLERRGVEHVFGLCGHTNIAVLAAMEGSKLKAELFYDDSWNERIAMRAPELVVAEGADGKARDANWERFASINMKSPTAKSPMSH